MKCAGHQRKVYVAWKRKMLHDVALHDVIGGHQAYIHRDLWRMKFCIWLRLPAVHVMHAHLTRDEIINSLREKYVLVYTHSVILVIQAI